MFHLKTCYAMFMPCHVLKLCHSPEYTTVLNVHLSRMYILLLVLECSRKKYHDSLILLFISLIMLYRLQVHNHGLFHFAYQEYGFFHVLWISIVLSIHIKTWYIFLKNNAFVKLRVKITQICAILSLTKDKLIQHQMYNLQDVEKIVNRTLKHFKSASLLKKSL